MDIGAQLSIFALYFNGQSKFQKEKKSVIPLV